MIRIVLCLLYFMNILPKLKVFNSNRFTYQNQRIYYSKNQLLNENEIRNNNFNKIITISPGGYKGFYQLGIASYIRDNYKINDYLFSGASAGAWVSLMMVYKGDHHEFVEDLINFTKTINNTRLDYIQNQLKEVILSKYKTDEFDFSRLFIGVVQINKIYKLPYLNIYTNFTTLEDAIDCCIVSSHIPFITGGLIKKYNNKISFDGGFSNFPYLKIFNSSIILNIHPNLWVYANSNNKKNKLSTIYNFSIYDFTTLFFIGQFNLTQLYNKGYNDSKNNKYKLYNIL